MKERHDNLLFNIKLNIKNTVQGLVGFKCCNIYILLLMIYNLILIYFPYFRLTWGVSLSICCEWRNNWTTVRVSFYHLLKHHCDAKEIRIATRLSLCSDLHVFQKRIHLWHLQQMRLLIKQKHLSTFISSWARFERLTINMKQLNKRC